MPNPVIRKGARLPYHVSVACWIDLLGYGGMISKSKFNPAKPEAKDALNRLRHFHQIVAKHSHRLFPTLVMNDGAVAYRDLSLRSRTVTFDFLCRSHDLFDEISEYEKKHDYPGPRLVVATGFRALGRRAGMDNSGGHFKSIMQRFTEGKIAAEQAIREASNIRPVFDIVPQLQANFAFTKAYVAESMGKRGGLSGSSFYVDTALFEPETPSWLGTESIINWKHEDLNLSARFAKVTNIQRNGHPVGGPIEARSALEVAIGISDEPDIIKMLLRS